MTKELIEVSLAETDLYTALRTNNGADILSFWLAWESVPPQRRFAIWSHTAQRDMRAALQMVTEATEDEIRLILEEGQKLLESLLDPRGDCISALVSVEKFKTEDDHLPDSYYRETRNHYQSLLDSKLSEWNSKSRNDDERVN